MPIVFRESINEDTELGIWKIDETAGDLYARLQLDEREKAVFESFRNQNKRSLHWLGSRVLLRTLMNTDRYINLKVTQQGKPYLVNFPHHISISHSYDYAAVMISLHGPVGVDIEQISGKIARVADRFLIPEELEFIDRGRYYDHLYACWGAKEAVYKWYGKGGLPFYGGILLDPFSIDSQGIIRTRIELLDGSRDIIVQYRNFDGYMVAWCTG